MGILRELKDIFVGKRKPVEDKLINCKGCGIEVSGNNAVLDVNTGSFVCKNCKNLGVEGKNMAENHRGSDVEAYERESQKKEAENSQNNEKEDERLTHKCRKCSYLIPYTKSKGKPGSCGYCGARLE
ncbi:MAG: hypothetical protein ABIG89_01855 [Candidatus Woesearchaeota archaeon]